MSLDVGEHADVLGTQLGLLYRLDARGAAPSTVVEAAGRLREVLAERRVLLLAASLAGGVPVDLSDVLTGLDEATAALVADVIAHAAGHRRYVLTLGDGTVR